MQHITLYPIEDGKTRLITIASAINLLNTKSSNTGITFRNGLDILAEESIFCAAAKRWESGEVQPVTISERARDIILNTDNIRKIMDDNTGVILLDFDFSWTNLTKEQSALLTTPDVAMACHPSWEYTPVELEYTKDFSFAMMISKMARYKKRPLKNISSKITDLTHITVSGAPTYNANTIEKLAGHIFETFVETEYHACKHIDNALKLYDSQCQNGEIWWHDRINKDPALIQSFLDWAALTLSPTNKTTNTQVRAFMMVKKDGAPFPYDHAMLYSVAGKTLLAVLQALGINVSNPYEIESEDAWQLPVAPGLPFLLALREFIWILSEEAPPESIQFDRWKINTNAWQYSILIKMSAFREKNGNKREVCAPYNLGMNYTAGNGIDGAASNTTHAFRNLLFASLEPYDEGNPCKGLKTNTPHWMKVFTTLQHNLPQGKVPCVGVYFYPFSVRLIWTAGE